LAEGTLAAGQPALLAVLIISGLLNAGYFFPIVYRAFFRRSERFTTFAEASPLMVVPLCLTALLSVGLGIFPDAFFHWFSLANETAMSVLQETMK
jgi:multicomponent Na+:H+ antiporter subunit D